MESLLESFPCRERELQQLQIFINEGSELLPESVFIHGQPAVGKTTITCKYLESAGALIAYVNCIECYSMRLLLDKIISQLLPQDPQPNVRCDSFMALVHLLKLARSKGSLNSRPHVLVLDNVEYLDNLGDRCINFFAALQELTLIYTLTVIFISRVIPEKFDITPAVILHFPQYNKDELTKIFQLFKPPYISEELYSNYISTALAVFIRATRDLNEMKNLILDNVSKYMEPINRGEATANDTLLLWRLVTPHLKASLNSAYLGIASENDTDPTKPELQTELITHKKLRAFDLPYYAKYFLIAGYLASYNSPKHDRRLFLKNHGKQRKKNRKDVSKSQTTELLGPKSFSLDRLLAIFYAIMEEKASLTVNLMSQIASLVELRLLAKIGDGVIDNPKFKCMASYDCVAAVGSTLGFNLKKYLLD
ncbi:Origin recognition complex subunit [Nesidiocoris tenuis]|uniref:Origin recognition complex subunit n=1 Tax=Nesidiocoris tenuis TaxID=355587 RepID=A0ABN7AU28_9HEMI|nr:Origin recognition complex subunit [Nesidiocoris tenuis]